MLYDPKWKMKVREVHCSNKAQRAFVRSCTQTLGRMRRTRAPAANAAVCKHRCLHGRWPHECALRKNRLSRFVEWAGNNNKCLNMQYYVANERAQSVIIAN